MLFSHKIDNNVTPKPYETQTESSTKTGASRRDKKSQSFFSRANQGLVAALLASPLGAQARPFAPAALAGLPGSSSRHLLASCVQGSWKGPAAGNFSDLPSDTPAATVSSDFAWSQQRNDSCAPNGVDTAPVNMTNLPLTIGFSQYTHVSGAVGNIDATAVQKIKTDLGRVADFINLQVQIPTLSGNALPNVVFVEDLNTSGSSPWVSRFVQSQGVTTAVVGRVNPNSTDVNARLSALGGALGLATTGDFDGSNLASVTTTSTNVSCANATRFGSLDLAVMAARYGLTSAASGNHTITLTSDYGSGGIIASAATNNTLRAVYNGNTTVQLSMVDDGSWPSLVGDTAVLLAPGSVITTADLSQTPGAVIVGNNYTNYIRGSGGKGGDTVSVGSGLSYLTGGTANAALVINYPNTTVVWNDYDQEQAEIYVGFGDANTDSDPSVQAAKGAHGIGTQLTINNASVVQLPNVPLASFGDSGAGAEWAATNAGIDFLTPVACASQLEPIYAP